MSKYEDINQLLEEIGTSSRSASDPWTISRGYNRGVKRDSYAHAVLAEMNAPPQQLESAIQTSEQIARADLLPSIQGGTTTNNNSTGGSGFLGGLLSFFPLASGIAKLFGLGGHINSAPVVAPFIPPPSINFEGALSGHGSIATNVSYGEDGLPRTTSSPPNVVSLSPPTVLAPPFVSSPSQVLFNVTGAYHQGESAVSTSSVYHDSSDQDPVDGVPIPTSALSQPAAGTDEGNSASRPVSSVDPDDRFADTTLIGTGNYASEVIAKLGALTSTPFVPAVSSDSPMADKSVLAASDSLPAHSSSVAGTNSVFNASVPSGRVSLSPQSASALTSNSLTGSSSVTQQGQNILVQVQAMDSQSFMDHSHEIAQAVRQAMLNLHSVNDVILDL